MYIVCQSLVSIITDEIKDNLTANTMLLDRDGKKS